MAIKSKDSWEIRKINMNIKQDDETFKYIINHFLISKSHKTLWSDTLWKITHQEPPQNGNLARRHNQMFHKKAFSKWQTSNGKTIQYFRTGYSFVQRAIQTWEAHIIQVQKCPCNCSRQVNHLQQLETAHNKIYCKCNWK